MEDTWGDEENLMLSLSEFDNRCPVGTGGMAAVQKAGLIDVYHMGTGTDFQVFLQ